jgi:hypothetical protein
MYDDEQPVSCWKALEWDEANRVARSPLQGTRWDATLMPTQLADGTWQPGEWTEDSGYTPELCAHGWHGFVLPHGGMWIYDRVYRAEVRGEVAKDKPGETEGKVAGRQMRLLALTPFDRDRALALAWDTWRYLIGDLQYHLALKPWRKGLSSFQPKKLTSALKRLATVEWEAEEDTVEFDSILMDLSGVAQHHPKLEQWGEYYSDPPQAVRRLLRTLVQSNGLDLHDIVAAAARAGEYWHGSYPQGATEWKWEEYTPSRQQTWINQRIELYLGDAPVDRYEYQPPA